jgi:hypothetical protein
MGYYRNKLAVWLSGKVGGEDYRIKMLIVARLAGWANDNLPEDMRREIAEGKTQ